MKPRHVVLAAVIVPALGCFIGDSVDNDLPAGAEWDQPEISGIWMREVDGYYVVREFFGAVTDPDVETRTTNEWFYTVGEEPELYSHGVYYVDDGYTLATGDVVDDALYVYPDRDAAVYVDVIVELTDDKLVLQGLYDEEPVEYQAVDELP